MIGVADLKARVEERVGATISPALFDRVEERARRKLDWINERAGRNYGEDGYGDEYLVILTVEAIREMALSAWCNVRSSENLTARKGVLA